MFSGRFSALLKRLDFRIGLFSSLIIFLCAVVLFALAYLLINASLRRENRKEIELRLLEFWAQYQTGGVDLIRTELSNERNLLDREQLLVRITNHAGKVLFISLPGAWRGFEPLLDRSADAFSPGGITVIRSSQHPYALEAAALTLEDGNLIQVGKSTEQRLAALRHFRESFLLVMSVLVVLSFGGGLVLAANSLRPLRKLTHTIQSIIETRNMDTRVEASGAGDELDKLISHFNTMLNRLSHLIQGMKDTLDNVGHDLRTPLARMRVTAELALQTPGANEAQAEALADCIEETDRLLKVVRTLMDISAAESGVMSLDLKPVSLKTMVASVLDLYQYIAEEKGLSMRSSVADDLVLFVDPVRTEQALANLVDNAIKYSRSGGKVEVRGFAVGARAVVAVMDTGMGISRFDIPRIWDRLFRSDASRSQPGQGLGLSLVKAIIDAHGGSVDVKSDQGKGSEFLLYLPLAESALQGRSD